MSEMVMRVIHEHANEAVISMDESGSDIRWNRAAGELIGCSHQDAVVVLCETLIVVEISLTHHRFDSAWEYTAFVHDISERKRID